MPDGLWRVRVRPRGRVVGAINLGQSVKGLWYGEGDELEDGWPLTPIMASLTRSFLINPALYKFSINSVLVDPEQYHAMVKVLVGRQLIT